MVATREEAARIAEASKTNEPGACQKWTRTLFGAPSAGDQDHDGDADAVDGWKSEPQSARHTDRNPPRGVPVAWSGGSHGFGHRAISLGGGKIRSTDAGGSGRVATVDLSWPEQHWGLKYLGWSETIDGLPIPAEKAQAKPVVDLRVDIVDISHFQDGRIDYAAAKKAGIKGLFHKATEGVTFEDANYAQRRAEAKKAGVPFGAYHFARPNGADDAILEARHFLKVADPQPGDLIPMLDLEDQGGLSRAALTSWVAVWAGAIRSALGVWPILYTPFDLDKTLGLMLWVARYNNENAAPNVPKPWKRWDLRQFTNGVFGVPNHVAGFGHVDLSTMRDGLTLADLTIPVPAPPPAKPEPTVPTWELHVEHASLEVFDTADEVTADVAALFATDPDHASFTEANGGHSDELEAAAAAAGYVVVSGPSGERIAVSGQHTLPRVGLAGGHPGARQAARPGRARSPRRPVG
jgi:GH25 family lysozyme M1 (1,4-beta-N-acetylmuramidase)